MAVCKDKFVYRGIVQGSEHWVTKNKVRFQSNYVQRGSYQAVLHIKLSCGHSIDMRKFRKDKMPLRTHCPECEAIKQKEIDRKAKL